MKGRSGLMLIPLPVAVVVVVVFALLTTVSMISAGYRDLRDQCVNAIGPDPAQVTSSSAQTGGQPRPFTQPTSVATANPYASLTLPPDARVTGWLGECVAAAQALDYQGGLLLVRNIGPTVDCALLLARGALEQSAAAGASGAPFEAAQLARWVSYHASLAAGPGGCRVTPMTVQGAQAVPARNAGRRGCAPLPALDDRGRAPVVLPERIADQALCGQPVDRAAISAGDLVFWQFQRHAPERVGIAIDATTVTTTEPVAIDVITVITTDPIAGKVVQLSLSPSTAIGVKRVLEADGG
ncbi:hypothetical protein [Nocardia brasiliensis]|uniref:hypothetical protein n=1 Tax=Nocardia brasiliensis TaxID=37326 RepID=UPI0024573CEC|nr:hypothetical protein [Nocardia brasiliensis]